MSETKHKFTLFSGTDCHLCDVAKQLMAPYLHQGLVLNQINVKEQRDYYHEYGARIPVLKNDVTGAELGWPFDEHTLAEFLD